MKSLRLTALLLVSAGAAGAQVRLADEAHPNLLFTADQVPLLQDRITREPYATWWATVLERAQNPPNPVTEERTKARYAKAAAFAWWMTGDILLAHTAAGLLLDMKFPRDGVALYDRDLKPITAASVTTDLTEDAAEKGGYEHFMLKEIHEQPTAIAQTMRGRCTASGIDLSELGLSLETLKGVKRIQLLACGTSLYSAMVGKYALERYARLPTQAWSASEYRYADPVIDKTDLIVAISQSGETADTIEALKRARAAGARAGGQGLAAGGPARHSAKGHRADLHRQAPAGSVDPQAEVVEPV